MTAKEERRRAKIAADPYLKKRIRERQRNYLKKYRERINSDPHLYRKFRDIANEHQNNRKKRIFEETGEHYIPRMKTIYQAIEALI